MSVYSSCRLLGLILPFSLLAVDTMAQVQATAQDKQKYNAFTPNAYIIREVDVATRSTLAPADYQRLISEAKLAPEQAHFSLTWEPGSLLPLVGTDPVPLPGLRYNLALQMLEIGDSKGEVRLVPVGNVRGFVLGKKGQPGSYLFETRDYLDQQGVRGTSFFESLNEGAARVFLLHEVMQETGSRIAVYNVDTRAPQYLRTTRLFVQRPGQQDLVEQPLNRREILRLFGKDAPLVAAYATEKKLSYEQVPDLVRLVEYFNTLKQSAK